MISLLSLLATVCQILALLIFVRIILSYFPGAAYNPVGRIICAIADPILAPFRRILPTFGGLDFSPMLAILVLYALARFFEEAQFGTVDTGGALLSIVIQLILGIFGIFCLLLLIRVVMSLFHAAPFHPMVLMVRQVTSPLVRPFSGMVPVHRSRGFDTAAMIALVFYAAAFVIVRLILLRI